MSHVPVSLHPYFKVHSGQMAAVKSLLPKFVKKSTKESKIIYYEFTINDDVVFCREGYDGAGGVISHLDNVKEELGKMLKLADLIRFEIHGPAKEIDQLRKPLAHLKPEWFVYECGIDG